MAEKEKILIVEDDPKIINLVEIHLRDLGFSVDKALDGLKGLEKSIQNMYQLIILDIMLPKLDGIELCKRIRENNKLTPILMLTARSEEFDKVLGLEIGADEYITKPFHIREFIARVKAILRRIRTERERKETEDKSRIILAGKIKIDFEQHRVFVDNKEVELTAKEFELLALFAGHPERTYNRDVLLEQVWGYNYSGYEHTVNSHINRLRNKIEKDPTRPKYIKTLWGVGYRFEIPEEDLQ